MVVCVVCGKIFEDHGAIIMCDRVSCTYVFRRVCSPKCQRKLNKKFNTIKLGDLEKLKKMEEPTDPNAKIPWCNLGYTVQQSKEKCPLGGCWKFRCFNSKLHDEWSKGREAYQTRTRRLPK